MSVLCVVVVSILFPNTNIKCVKGGKSADRTGPVQNCTQTRAARRGMLEQRELNTDRQISDVVFVLHILRVVMSFNGPDLFWWKFLQTDNAIEVKTDVPRKTGGGTKFQKLLLCAQI